MQRIPYALPTMKSTRGLFGRFHLTGGNIGEKIIQRAKLNELYKPGEHTIIDAYPGPGVWSVAMFNELQPKKHYLMEVFRTAEKHLQANFVDHSDGRALVVEEDPYQWTGFEVLESEYLDANIEKLDRRENKLHPGLLLTGNCTMKKQGEQLFMQWLNCVITGNWLQKYGNVRMLLWTNSSTAMKMVAKRGSQSRARCTVLGEASADISILAVTEDALGKRSSAADLKRRTLFEPVFAEYDPVIIPRSELLMDTSSSIALIDIRPKWNDLDLQNFEYVTKRLFVLGSLKLKEAINTLGCGAGEYLLPSLRHLEDLRARDLSVEQFCEIAEVFRRWPFKPEILFDVFEDTPAGFMKESTMVTEESSD